MVISLAIHVKMFTVTGVSNAVIFYMLVMNKHAGCHIEMSSDGLFDILVFIVEQWLLILLRGSHVTRMYCLG